MPSHSYNTRSSNTNSGRNNAYVKRTWPGKLIASIVLLIITGASMFFFKRYADVLFPAYRIFSKNFMRILAAVYSVIPVAAWDLIAIGLVIGVITSFFVMIFKRTSFMEWLTSVLLMAAIIAFEVICGWMLNHYAPSLAGELGLEIRKYSKEELLDATEYYFDMAATLADKQERNASGSLVRQDFDELAEIAGAGYAKIEDLGDVFRGGSGQPVKRLSVFGELLMYSGITGEFMPVTGESTVPGNENIVSMPFSMLHEAAHRLGIAAEEEANFAAYLAAEASDDVRFTYSGYYIAFVYCYNKMASADPEALRTMIKNKVAGDERYALVVKDVNDTSEYYKQYESKLEEVATKTNDTYLKTFSEESGVKSYGEVVDELIAWQQKKADY